MDNDAILRAELRDDEGRERFVYFDHLGYATIGCGRLVDKRKGGGLSDDEIDYLLANDLKRVAAGLDKAIPWWRTLDPVRRRVFQNMGHQLGVNGLLNFKKAVAAAKAGDYITAAAEMLDSTWAKVQTPARAQRLAKMMRTGAV